MDHLPHIPYKPRPCEGCGQPSRTAYCDRCVAAQESTVRDSRGEGLFAAQHHGCDYPTILHGSRWLKRQEKRS